MKFESGKSIAIKMGQKLEISRNKLMKAD